MDKSYNDEAKKAEKMKAILRRLPQKDAPASFEEKLMANIRRVDAGEEFSLLGKSKSNWKLASFSTAAGLLIAITLFNLNTEAPEGKTQMLQMAKNPQESKVDSTQNKAKSFDRKLNLVGDQKKK